MRQAGLQLASPYPRQLAHGAVERLAQPLVTWSAFTTLPMALARTGNPAISAAIGQFLVVDTAAYRDAGGHEAVAGEVVEDVEVLRALKRRGYRGMPMNGGAIAAKGRIDEQRAYLQSLIAAHGLDDLTVGHQGGHLTRCRATDSPVAAGRILLAGDAAGLLEPWTREGISFALRSGTLAGAAAARIACVRPAHGEGASTDAIGAIGAIGAHYAQQVDRGMGAEMGVGFRALAAYERHPKAFYRALASKPGWDAFVRLARGETTLARAGRHRVVRTALATLGAR